MIIVGLELVSEELDILFWNIPISVVYWLIFVAYCILMNFWEKFGPLFG